MFFVKLDRVAAVKLDNMFSPPWTKMICKCLEESIGGLFVNLNLCVAIKEVLLNAGWASVLSEIAVLVASHSG